MKLFNASATQRACLFLVGLAVFTSLAFGYGRYPSLDYSNDSRCAPEACEGGCAPQGFCNRFNADKCDNNAPCCDCTEEDCLGNPGDPVSNSFTLSLGSPGTPFAIGNRFVLSRVLSHNIDVTYRAPMWNAGSETVPTLSYSLGIELVGTDTADPNVRKIKAISLSGSAPSTLSVAVGGAETGITSIGLESDSDYIGTINAATGAIDLKFKVWVTNNYWPASFPGTATVHLTGTVDRATNTATITYNVSGRNNPCL